MFDYELENLRGRRVLVTGHTGFKGSWLVACLNHIDCTVAGLSTESWANSSHWESIKSELSISEYYGDIRSLEIVENCFREFEPEVVFHLAAEPIVSSCFFDPVKAFDVNVMGTVNVLQVARNCPALISLVLITSDKCYENLEQIWGYREIDLLGGKDPYSASKACAELVISSFSRSFFSDSKTRVCSCRAGNVIGGGDWSPDRLVPDMMRCVIEGKKITLRNPNATRPWQHVLDPLGGYMLVADLMFGSEKYATSWNFGPSSTEVMTVKELVQEFISVFQTDPDKILEISSSEFVESGLLALNTDKASAMLGWKPAFSMSQSLEWTSDWYFQYSQRGTGNTLSQVERFFNG